MTTQTTAAVARERWLEVSQTRTARKGRWPYTP